MLLPASPSKPISAGAYDLVGPDSCSAQQVASSSDNLIGTRKQ
jgi:hypothetical protein